MTMLLKHLTPRQREAVIHLTYGRKTKEIALLMGISRGLVRTYIRESACRLRQHFNLYITNDSELLHAIKSNPDECNPKSDRRGCEICV